MKRLLALVFTAALLTPMPISVYATNDEFSTVVFNDEFNFRLVETVDENNRIIRTYQKDEQPQTRSTYGLRSVGNDIDNYERTKALLSDLGMGDAFISELSDEQLESYAESESITGIVSYTKSDNEGNITYVSEEEASVYSVPGSNINQQGPEGDGDGSGITVTKFDTENEDSYMRLHYMVFYYGEDLYHHIVSAKWLTMPSCRSFDSLGVCSTGLTVELGSLQGWYGYDHSHGTMFGAETIECQYEFATEAFQQLSNGVWSGVGVVVNLPENTSANGYTHIYSNYYVYLEYESRVRYPQAETYIETNAMYEHSIIKISASPSLEIGVGGLGCSIGLSCNWEREKRSAYFDESIHYIPE